MNKKVWLTGSILAVMILGVYFFVFFKPPLAVGTIATDGDRKSVVVGVGNQGFQKIKIVDVSVNNNSKPLETKVQLSNALLGFIIADDFESPDAAEYNFMDPKDVIVKPGTSPTSNFKKMDEGTATEEDEIYGISVLYPIEIFKVDITYSYFGIQFTETVELN